MANVDDYNHCHFNALFYLSPPIRIFGILPLIVLAEILIDVAMTLLVLWFCGISLNLMSMIGIIVMCGIVINDSILKIDTIIRLQRPQAVAMIAGMTIGILASLYGVPSCYILWVEEKITEINNLL